MAIVDIVRKTVVFIGIMEKEKFIPKATAFLASYLEDGYSFLHLVTAEHVVSMLLTKNHKLWARVNLKNGESGIFPVDDAGFRYHPATEIEPTDVAVSPISSSLTSDDGKVIEMDAYSVPLNGPDALIVTDELIRAHRAGIGDEVAIIGLFRSHFGRDRNIPIARIGNIAAMREEPVNTKYTGPIDAYLIEARSIGGLSGSPVFLTLPESKEVPRKAFRLFGMMQGHFDVKNLNEDVVVDDEADATSGIHTGLGVVVPVQKIIETVQHPELSAMRKARAKEMREEGDGATSDLASSDAPTPPANDANPTHREDFTRLVSLAARKPEPKD